ncbi:MAG: hypothetical protein KGD57_02360 [Candidatus Lokiarchaeota archaeon]|nr:hypothetical protein [Candidatus Lokiarchaeota archaeon]
MEGNSSLDNENEIIYILDDLKKWNNLFTIDHEYYFDGWAIFMTEKNLYPRYIVIFKSYKEKTFTIKSYEVYFSELYTKKYKELIQIDKISNIKDLLREIKEIIYGKDFHNYAKKIIVNKIK